MASRLSKEGLTVRLHKRQRERKFWAGVAVGLLISLAGFFIWWIGPASAGQPPAAYSEPLAAEPAIKPIQVLVMGVDERDHLQGSRTDTMMLVRIAGDQVRVLSLPRDTMVKIEGHEQSKLNSAYTYGGVVLAKQVTGELLQMPVDYYVKVNLAGFQRLVDLMGGVQYNVPEAMHYVDPTDGTYIDLQPGPQLLDGAKAEQLVRFRHDAIGDDMGRIHRQQEFLKAAISQALTPANLLKLPSLISTARSYVDTDIPLGDQLRIGKALFTAKQHDAIVQETLPGHGGYVDGLSYFLVDQDQLQQLITTWAATGDRS
jgi:LCP family protein required for cell wall assembly